MAGRRILRILQAIGYELLPVHPKYALEQTKIFLSNLTVFWSFIFKTSLFLSKSLLKLVVELKLRVWITLAVWGLCFLLFWYLEFGSIYMLGTGFVLIFANLGDTRREGDMSAWVSSRDELCSLCRLGSDSLLISFYDDVVVLTECIQSRIYDYARDVISRTNGS